MDINYKFKVHNRFDVEVRDAVTGELKQTAVGYNVLCTRFFGVRLRTGEDFRDPVQINFISFGSGTGTPSGTDTSLFSYIGYKDVTEVETVYAYPTSHTTVRIKLEANEYVGSTITEVGTNCINGSAYFVGKPLSHAMLKDSEGHQISITKTDSDVVYISYTLYCTWVSGGFGSNGIYPSVGYNTLIRYILKGTIPAYAMYHSPLELTASEQLGFSPETVKGSSFTSGVGDLDTLTFALPEIYLLNSESTNKPIKAIGIPGMGGFTFPDASVLSDVQVRDKTIGAGDGTTTDFNIGVPEFKSGTFHVYVDGVEASSADYDVYEFNNEANNPGLYYTATMFCTDANVTFGDYASQPTEANSYRSDPLRWEKGYADIPQPNYANITAANPIYIDFGTAKAINRVSYGGYQRDGCWSFNALSNAVIEYSNDDVNWTQVTNYAYIETSDQCYKFEFDDATARYWRVYPSSGTLHCFCYKNSGNGDGASHFGLGFSRPGLHFHTAPANGTVITADYDIDVPYKTENNVIKMVVTISLQRG